MLRTHAPQRSLASAPFWCLAVLAYITAACSNSNWTQVAKESGGTIYVDYSKTEKAGTRTTLTYLYDRSSSKGIGQRKIMHRSVISVEQFDCAENRSRELRMDFFDGSMGSGSNVLSERSDFWMPRPFNGGSIEELWKVACR